MATNYNSVSEYVVEGIPMRQKMIDIGFERNSEKTRDFYNAIAHVYSEYSGIVGQDVGAMNLAKALKVEQPNKQCRILDVACGFGLVGLQLKALGYQNVDGVDCAETMLELCRSKNVYQNYMCAIIQPDKRTEVADNTYDAIIMNGSMGSGHISPNAIPELARMVKPGGALVFNVTHCWDKNMPESSEKSMTSLMDTMVKDGILTKWNKKIEKYFEVTDETACIYTSTVA